jgi:proline dehydrogenase
VASRAKVLVEGADNVPRRRGVHWTCLTLATHDAALRDGLLAALGPMHVEMLLGVRPEDHAPLLARGVRLRLYVPYGRDWFRYSMRRVAESQGAG